VELATAFRDGPAAARSWLELMRNNDVQAALQHCTGPATWTTYQGRRACALPLWLDTAAVEPPRKP
jgi:ketosteroid isomerase-like protein